MFIIEIIAVIFSLLSVYFTIKEDSFCWPIGIVGIIAYSVIFKDNHDWVNLILQFVFLMQSFIAWKNWHKAKDNIEVSRLSINDIANTVVNIFSVFLLTFSMSVVFSGHDRVLDSISATLSIFGMYFLSTKKIEAWYCWILADILFIFLFYKHQLYLSCGLYFIFLLMAVSGLMRWKKQL